MGEVWRGEDGIGVVYLHVRVDFDKDPFLLGYLYWAFNFGLRLKF